VPGDQPSHDQARSSKIRVNHGVYLLCSVLLCSMLRRKASRVTKRAQWRMKSRQGAVDPWTRTCRTGGPTRPSSRTGTSGGACAAWSTLGGHALVHRSLYARRAPSNCALRSGGQKVRCPDGPSSASHPGSPSSGLSLQAMVHRASRCELAPRWSVRVVREAQSEMRVAGGQSPLLALLYSCAVRVAAVE